MRPCLVSPGSSSAPSVTRMYHFESRGPSLGIFETGPSLNLREQNRHAPLSALFPAHHDASPGLRIVPRARVHTPPRDSRGVVLRRAHSRGDDENRVAAFLFERPDHDNHRTRTTTLGRHANSTRARRAAPSRHQRIYTRDTRQQQHQHHRARARQRRAEQVVVVVDLVGCAASRLHLPRAPATIPTQPVSAGATAFSGTKLPAGEFTSLF